MSVTVASVKELGGTPFASISDARVALWLAFATARLSTSTWGASYDDALETLTLHYLSLDPETAGSGAGGGAGTVSGVTVGDVSVDYAVPSSGGGGSSSDAALGSTFWGRLFLEMREATKPFPFLI